LGAVAAEGRQGSRQDVRGQRLRAVHQRKLGDEIERTLVRSADHTTDRMIRT